MKLNHRQAKLLTRFKAGDQQSYVNEYLAPLLKDVRDRADSATSTDDMLRYQGQIRLLKQMLQDIDDSDSVAAKFDQQPRRTQ
jgi:hypothetical protein